MAFITSLINLLEFVPQNDKEREIFDSCKKGVLTEYLKDTNKSWSNGKFYLGGFIQMTPYEEITLQKIEEVKTMREKKYIEYGGPCNTAEAASIWNSERQLDEIETIVKKYMEIYKIRYKIKVENELLQIKKINNDVVSSIVDFI
jgi:hypothetical protein